MKIVSWNCNGAFRKKYEELDSYYEADIYLIQECENPKECNDQSYKNWAKNFKWLGNNKNKGIGIFAKENVHIQPLHFPSNGYKYFLPVLVNQSFQLVNVWTQSGNEKRYRYIGQLWNYVQINKHRFNNVMIGGDWNSNPIWDDKHDYWSHSEVVSELKKINIESVYHHISREANGNESNPTFYMYRHKDKPYHIDYMFASPNLLNAVKEFSIGESAKWLEHSDHLPILTYLEEVEDLNDRSSNEDLKSIMNIIQKFRVERDWLKFHNPKDLANALSIEASELLELFLWKNEHEIYQIPVEKLKDELADIFVYALYLKEHYNLNLEEIVKQKMIKNSAKYPVSKSKGNSKKYTELNNDE